jgi:hypothetical protein
MALEQSTRDCQAANYIFIIGSGDLAMKPLHYVAVSVKSNSWPTN